MNADKYKQSAIVSTEIIKGMWQKKKKKYAQEVSRAYVKENFCRS